jgi:hypothetical protein
MVWPCSRTSVACCGILLTGLTINYILPLTDTIGLHKQQSCLHYSLNLIPFSKTIKNLLHLWVEQWPLLQAKSDSKSEFRAGLLKSNGHGRVSMVAELQHQKPDPQLSKHSLWLGCLPKSTLEKSLAFTELAPLQKKDLCQESCGTHIPLRIGVHLATQFMSDLISKPQFLQTTFDTTCFPV